MDREILFRGKQTDDGEWAYGYYFYDNFQDKAFITFGNNCFKIGNYCMSLDRECPNKRILSAFEVIPKTVGQYTGLTDKNGKKIFEGDIVQYLTYDDFDCQSIVKFGNYEQDGSDGEYNAIDCIGFYVEVNNFTCPDWCENDPWRFKDYRKQKNLLEVASYCQVIGNIHDNPELSKEETK